MKSDGKVGDKYPDLDLFFLESLGLYHAKQRNDQECLIDDQGEIVYTTRQNTSREHYWTNFSYRHLDKLDEEFNKKISYWIQFGLTHSMSVSVFGFKNKQVFPLLEQEQIIWAEPLSPSKILIQTAVGNTDPHFRYQIGIYDIEKNELKNILKTRFGNGPDENSVLLVHKIYGTEYLFSVQTDRRKDSEEDFDHDINLLYNCQGERLTDFETTIGQNGEKTWFEPGKRSLGITYRMMESPVRISSSFYHNRFQVYNSLIDAKGNHYGDFYYIYGQSPGSLGKTSTRLPKYIDKKLLCLSVPFENNQSPCLAILDENHNILQTPYECPWLFTFISRALVKDKKIFGETCITVLDSESYVRLIDLNGQEISETRPIKFEGLMVNYIKLFMKQIDIS